jgi:DNA replication licensing factor MCM2
MRIAESFCKMRLSEYCSAQDIDRAIAVTVESFIASQKVSAKKALSRAFAKYVMLLVSRDMSVLTSSL